MERKNKQLNEFAMPEPTDMAAPSHMAPPADMPAEPGAGLLPNGELDNEGAMVKADLFKLAQYSYKLFKKIEDNDQFESWVQAKVTKAADYIASVYHYLEYEMKISEYGQKLSDSDVLSESQKQVMSSMLMEAKAKISKLKKLQAEKMSGKKEEVAQGMFKESSRDKNPKIDLYNRESGDYIASTNFSPTVKHAVAGYETKYPDMVGKVKASKSVAHGRFKESSENEADHRRQVAKDDKVTGKDKNEKWHDIQDQKAWDEEDRIQRAGEEKARLKRKAARASKVDEAKEEVVKPRNFVAKNAKATTSGAGVHTNKKKAAKDGDVKHKKSMELDEAKPSAGVSAEKKSATVKDAKAGKDIGKKGPGFEKVEKAAKKSGAKDPKAVAAAAMWKTIKRKAVKEGVDTEESQLDELNLKPWEKKSAHSKAGFKALADKKSGQMKDIDAKIDAADAADDDAGVKKGNEEWMKARKRKENAERKASRAMKEAWGDGTNDDAEVSAKNFGKAAGNIWQGVKNTATAAKNAKDDVSQGIKTTVAAAKKAKADISQTASDLSAGFSSVQNPEKASAKAAPEEEYRIVRESAELSAIKILSGLK